MKKEKKIKLIKSIIPYLIIILVVVLIRTFIITPAKVDGSSMQPTLYDNNIVLLNKLKYKINDVKRFDIVVIKHNNEKLIKRVVALPNEHIEYKNNDLYINGNIIIEDFKHESTYDFKLESIGFLTIPGDKYFVIGDNRENSVDSRMIGLVDKSNILGIVSSRIFPLNKIGSIK